MIEIKPENLLSISVGRVVPREVDVSSFVTPDEHNQYFNFVSIDQQSLPDHFKDDWLFVSNIYSSIYLGEMFSFYIKCTNDSIQEAMNNVSVKIDIQIGNKVVHLKELQTESLDAKSSMDAILTHEIKDLLNHRLICTIGFNISNYERQTTRKIFNFQISKPFEVKTEMKIIEESNEMCIEATFTNMTSLPIQMRSVNFESQNFEVAALNYELGGDKWIFGGRNRLNTIESRQYLYLLKPIQSIRFNSEALKAVSLLGKLDIIWVTGIGAVGHIHTFPLEKQQNCKDIKVLVEAIPADVGLKSIFRIKLRLINCSPQAIQPVLNLINCENQSILWLGLATRNLGQLEAAQSIDFELSLYPIKPGLQSIPVLKVTDLISKNIQEYKELAFININ